MNDITFLLEDILLETVSADEVTYSVSHGFLHKRCFSLFARRPSALGTPTSLQNLSFLPRGHSKRGPPGLLKEPQRVKSSFLKYSNDRLDHRKEVG